MLLTRLIVIAFVFTYVVNWIMFDNVETTTALLMFTLNFIVAVSGWTAIT